MENSLTQSGILRIYISSTDHIHQKPLYEYLVFEAKKQGIAGATVLKGMMGYGASSVIHSYKFWEVSDKVPVVIEFIDDLNKVRSYYRNIHSELETMKYGCLATLEETNVLIYKSGTKRTFGN